MVLRIFSICLLIFTFSCSGNQTVSKFEDEKKEVVDAKTLYILHCETCHGLDGKKGTSGAADLSKSTFSDQQISNVIKNGNEKGMMPYKDIITEKEEINSLVEYVKTLRK